VALTGNLQACWCSCRAKRMSAVGSWAELEKFTHTIDTWYFPYLIQEAKKVRNSDSIFGPRRLYVELQQYDDLRLRVHNAERAKRNRNIFTKQYSATSFRSYCGEIPAPLPLFAAFHLDYCNSLLCGSLFMRLQWPQNATARLLSGACDHITPVLSQLRWQQCALTSRELSSLQIT